MLMASWLFNVSSVESVPPKVFLKKKRKIRHFLIEKKHSLYEAGFEHIRPIIVGVWRTSHRLQGLGRLRIILVSHRKTSVCKSIRQVLLNNISKKACMCRHQLIAQQLILKQLVPRQPISLLTQLITEIFFKEIPLKALFAQKPKTRTELFN